jgi:hypothetical protein
MQANYGSGRKLLLNQVNFSVYHENARARSGYQGHSPLSSGGAEKGDF